MATLMLLTRRPAVHAETLAHAPSLRAWLRQGWAVLFSHPEDFAYYDLEMDRWLAIVREAFQTSGIRPLALAPCGQTGPSSAAESATDFVDSSWISQVSDDRRAVLLEDPLRQHFGAVDLQACALRETISVSGPRFVMILDDELGSRKTLSYTSRASLPSPLEILACAATLRGAQSRRMHRDCIPFPITWDPILTTLRSDRIRA